MPGPGVITAGTPSVFLSAATDITDVCLMDSTHAIIAYTTGGGNAVYAVCATISGTGLSFGTAVAISGGGSGDCKIASLDSTHAIIVWHEGTDSGYGYANCLTLSGTTITKNTSLTFENGGSTDTRGICKMDSTHAVVTFNVGGTDQPEAICLSVSGTTLSAGSAITIEAVSSNYQVVAALDSSKAIAFYDDTSNTLGRACVLSLSGTTITAGTPATAHSGSVEFPGIDALSSTKAIAAFTDSSPSSKAKAVCLSVSGTTVTAGSTHEFTASKTHWIDVCAMSSTESVSVYSADVSGIDGDGTAIGLSVDGTTVSSGTDEVYENAASSYHACTKIDSGRLITVYQDAANSDYGTACVLSFAIPVASRIAARSDIAVYNQAHFAARSNAVEVANSRLAARSDVQVTTDARFSARPDIRQEQNGRVAVRSDLQEYHNAALAARADMVQTHLSRMATRANLYLPDGWEERREDLAGAYKDARQRYVEAMLRRRS